MCSVSCWSFVINELQENMYQRFKVIKYFVRSVDIKDKENEFRKIYTTEKHNNIETKYIFICTQNTCYTFGCC